MLFFFIELYLICHRLDFHKPVILALLCHQLIRCAEFRDSALVDDDYLVRLLQCGEPVRAIMSVVLPFTRLFIAS